MQFLCWAHSSEGMYSMKISKAIAGPDYIVDIYNDGAHIKTRNHPCPYQLIAIYDSRFDLAEFKQTLPSG